MELCGAILHPGNPVCLQRDSGAPALTRRLRHHSDAVGVPVDSTVLHRQRVFGSPYPQTRLDGGRPLHGLLFQHRRGNRLLPRIVPRLTVDSRLLPYARPRRPPEGDGTGDALQSPLCRTAGHPHTQDRLQDAGRRFTFRGDSERHRRTGNGIQGLWSMVSGVPAGGRQHHPHRTPLDDGQMGAQEAMVVGVIPLSLGIRQQDAGFGFA